MSEEHKGNFPTAYARIYAKCHPSLLTYARALTGDPELAEDLAAEAHFTLWRQLAGSGPVEAGAYEHVDAGADADAEADADVRLRRVVRELAEAVGAAPPEPVVRPLVRALRSLPDRDVGTLWRAESEGERVGEPLARARAALSQAFLGERHGAPLSPALAPLSPLAPPSQPSQLSQPSPPMAPARTPARLPLVGPALLTLFAAPGRTPFSGTEVVLGPLRFGAGRLMDR